MKKFKFFLAAIALMTCSTAFVSCDDDDDYDEDPVPEEYDSSDELADEDDIDYS